MAILNEVVVSLIESVRIGLLSVFSVSVLVIAYCGLWVSPCPRFVLE